MYNNAFGTEKSRDLPKNPTDRKASFKALFATPDKGWVSLPLENIRNLRTIIQMKAVFVELPAFERNRATYLNDDEFKEFQERLLKNPEAGDMIEGTGGLRKVRHGDPRRGKGTRGGLRVIYYWWSGGPQFWLFTLYDKDELENLTPKQKTTLKQLLKDELEARK